VLWAYEGWQSVTFSAGETVNPHRTFPRAFFIGTVALIGIYMTANFAYLTALGPTALAHANNAASESLQVVVGAWAAKLVLVAILISMFSAANAHFLTGPRVYYAMALDGLFFTRLSIVHHRFRTPAFAIIAGAVCSAIFAASGTFNQLLTYVVFAGWIFYALGAAAIFVYRRREPDAVRPFRVPGYPWTPLLYILSAMALVVNTIISKPMDAAVGLTLVAIGIPAYLFWRTRKPVGVAETVEEIEPELT
jgi:APA family basic amino acid/polyamine antiporter